MKIKLIFLIIPVLVIYTNRFITVGRDGTTRLNLVLIKPEYKYNKGLLQHELTHVKQIFRNLVVFFILKKLLTPGKFTLETECEAYAIQAKVNKIPYINYVDNLMTYKELRKYTKEEILMVLKKYSEK